MGHELQDGDGVYVLTNPIEETLQRIDYFHGKYQGLGPIAQTYIDEGGVFAFEMFAVYGKGKIMRAIICTYSDYGDDFEGKGGRRPGRSGSNIPTEDGMKYSSLRLCLSTVPCYCPQHLPVVTCWLRMH